MRMCRRLGAGGHGNVKIPVISIRSFEATGAGSRTVEPDSNTGAVGAYTGSYSALIYTNTRIDFRLKRRTKKLTVSALWESGYPNSPNYVGLYPGDYEESRAVYYYDDYIAGGEISILRREDRQGGSVTAEIVPDEPLQPGAYCIYFYSRPDGPGQVSGLPAEQITITGKV